MEAGVLVGRGRELELIAATLARVLGGERAVVMVTGEPGIGKTRLCEELAARVRAEGGRVAWGRASEVGLTPAFWPWIQLLAALEDRDDRAPSLTSSDDRADAAARVARFGEVAAFVGRRAPVALILDDVHAADPSSLQLLEDVLPLLAGMRVLVVLAARDSDASREVAAALGRIQRGAQRVPLGRLAAGEVAALVGHRADPARVFELSEGNPLFVEELVAAGGAALPALSSVRAVIRERVARLPPETGAALAAAAVLGREFRATVVADMVGQAALEPAARLGIVAMTAPDRYRFSHALVAEALADELDANERARLHLRAAQALERREPGETSALAHHLLAAGHLAAAAAVDAAERAAHMSFGQLAFEDAATLLAHALDALALAAPDDLARRASLLCARAEALQHAGHHTVAAELCDSASALARQLDDATLLARTALVRGIEMRFGRTDPVLVEGLREALARLGDRDAALRPKLLARLAAAEQPARDPAGPVALAREAIELARGLPARDRLDVMYVATGALVDYIEPPVLEPIHHEVLELARGVDRSIAAHTRLRLCFTALERIDRAGFEQARAAFAADATALRLRRWQSHAHMLDAMAALLDGRFSDAEAAARAAEVEPFIAGVHRAFAAWVRTDPPDLPLLASLVAHAPSRAVLQAWIALQRQAPDEVREALGQLPPGLPVDPDFAAMTVAATAYAAGREQIERCYGELLARRGRIVLASVVGSVVFDLVDRGLLMLAAAHDRHDAVDEHALDALDVAARLGSPVWTARVRADWADALARRGDAEKAAEQRVLALAGAERVGMPGLVARLRGTAPAAPQRKTGERVSVEKRGALWLVRGFGEEVHVKDSRGIAMVARLVAEPGHALHALDLTGGEDTGDAGPALDATARRRYRARLAELVAERDEAEAWADAGRVARASTEIEALTAEIERAFGLGGRERKVGAASERARTNVQRRIAHALEQIRAGSPRLGEHLAATLRTGTYCSYEP